MTKFMGNKGLWTGLYDKEDRCIHLGDTLSFDPVEWGGENVFVLEYDVEEGGLAIGFGASDLSEFCTIVKKWDAE